MSIVQSLLRSQRIMFQRYLKLVQHRADQRLRKGEDGPNHELAKTVVAAATLVELAEDGTVDDLLEESA
jgi:hypothetical protein